MATGKAVANTDPRELAVLESVRDLMAAVPEAGGDGFEFVERVLAAESANDLIGDDSDSKADEIEEYFGQMLRIDTIERATSEFANQLGAISDQFVIAHAVALERNNRECVFGIGATTPMVKLIKLHGFGAYPIVVRFDKSSKPTRQGYYPMNMSVIKVTEPVNA